MAKLKSFLKSAKWVLLAVLSAVLVAVGFALRGVFTSDGDEARTLPKAPKAVKDRADKAYEEALVAKAVAKAKADDKKAELDKTLKIADAAERRKRLAELLKTL